MKHKIDSIIFDLDGTLWDSTATVARAWHKASQQTGFVREPVTQAMVRSITGMPYDVIHPKLFPYLNQQQLNTLQERCAAEELAQLQKEGGQLYTGLEETLDKLKKQYPLFIVSNCQSGYIEAFLAYHQLAHYFTDIDCFGNSKKSKAENIGSIVERNQLQAPVYVGDTLGDYEASRKNGIPFVFTTYGFGEAPAAEIRIDSITELQQLFLA